MFAQSLEHSRQQWKSFATLSRGAAGVLHSISYVRNARCLAAISLAIMTCCAGTVAAQLNAPGTFADSHHPAGPPDPGKGTQIWRVDPITGSVSITIPFLHVQPSARSPFHQYSLQYNSSATFSLSSSIIPPDWVWNFSSASIVNGYDMYTWMPPNINAAGPPPFGAAPAPWTEVGSPTLRYSNAAVDYTPRGGNTISCEINGPFILTDGQGSHDLNIGGAVGGEGSAGGPCTHQMVSSSETTDGSTLQTNYSSAPYAIYPDGTKFLGGSLEDPNGNKISSGVGTSGTVYDSLGRPLYTVTESSSVAGASFPYPTSITTYTTGGQAAVYTLTWGSVPYNFKFPQPTSANITTLDSQYPGGVMASPGIGSVTVLKSITLANSPWSYKFDYDPTYGTIQKITFPTGGYVGFGWKVRTIGEVSPVAQSGMSTLAVTNVDVYDGTSVNSWTYDCSDLNLITGQLSCSVTDPQRNVSVYTGTGYGTDHDPLTDNESPSFHEVLREIKNSSSKLVRTINTTYGETGGAVTLPATVTTTMNDAPTGAPNQQQVKYIYDKYNNVIEKDESDFYLCGSTGVCTPPRWLRKTLSTYYWSQFPAYESAHIVDKPYTVTVTDSSGNPFAETKYGYDQFALTGSSGIQNHDDVNYPATFQGPRGNKTTESHCIEFAAAGCTQWATTTYRYDLTGQIVSVTDPCGNSACGDMDSSLGLHHTTTYSYDDDYTDASPLKPTNGFVTTVERPQTGGISHIEKFSYYYKTGEIYQHTDERNAVTSFSYANLATGHADPFNRIGQVTLPVTYDAPASTNASGYTQYSYNDAPGAFAVTQSSLMTTNGPKALTKTTNYDSLGRVINVTMADPEGDVKVDTTYDTNGNIYSISNSYRSVTEPTYGITIFSRYDVLGRKLQQTNPDGTKRSWAYAGNSVTVSDENLNQWKQVSDGLGRLSDAWEPKGTTHDATMQTSYSYDPLGNLLTVTQCGQACPSTSSVNRSFTYDSLSRLVQSFNPESGWTCYGSAGGGLPNGHNCANGYDANGNLSLKTDARGVVASYSYDSLNRILNKSFLSDATGTPSVCYQYDSVSIGLVTSEWTQRKAAGTCKAPSEGFLTKRAITSYDAMGRIRDEQQYTPASQSSGISYPLAYTYDLAGNIYTSTNGSTSRPITFTSVLNYAGRLQTLTSSGAYQDLLLSAQVGTNPPCTNSWSSAYTAFGALMNAQLGSSLTLNRAFDKRLRITCEIDIGNGITPATPGSVSLTITGAEQSK